MAVKLRCPDCRAKLKLAEDPDPGTDVECPKCGQAFPWEANVVLAGAADADGSAEPPRARARSGRDGSADPPADAGPGRPAKPARDPRLPKKKRAKKRKTQPATLYAIIAGAVLMVGCVAGVFIWFLTKKSLSQEMMSYLPDDCDEVFGLNLGHLQKYPDFYKECSNTFANTGFRKAGDLLGKALGLENLEGAVEYVLQGSGKAGGSAGGAPLEATVFRIKQEFDPGLLAKLPGAQKAGSYFTLPDPGFGYPGGFVRVFAPTNRLVVFCNGNIPENKFQGMLTGNEGNREATIYARGGPLIKQVSRGTAWKCILYGRSIPRFAGPPPKGSGGSSGGFGSEMSDEDALRKEIADILAQSQGTGYKASVGSRDVRGEWFVWYKDSDTASEMLKKWRDKEWVKDDEHDPPKWFKAMANKSGAGKTAVNVVRDGLSFRSSGELFIVRTFVETKLLQSGGVGQLVQNFTAQQPGGMGGFPGGGMPGGPGGGMPGPGGAMPGPGGGVVVPGSRCRPPGLVRPPRCRLQSWR